MDRAPGARPPGSVRPYLLALLLLVLVLALSYCLVRSWIQALDWVLQSWLSVANSPACSPGRTSLEY